MNLIQTTAPTIEPITLNELKLHLRLDSGSFADNITSTQSIAPGSHAITEGYALLGSAVDVLGKSAVVTLKAGTNGEDGTVDIKIQESDDSTTWTDWTGGVFAQVTEDNDNATYEKAYTGTKQYIRAVGQVLLAACEFGVDILTEDATLAEDDLLSDILTTAREHVEDITGRALLTQTWDAYFDEWPDGNHFTLPFGNLQSVTSVSYKDTEGTETTLTATTDYLVEANGDQKGRIVLPYGVSWPSVTLYPSNPIKIRLVCGWEEAADVPKRIKSAIKMICSDLYENRGERTRDELKENRAVDSLLYPARLW
ncbi:MAG: hypothetical protein GXY28_00090 [Bacteriovoracaceae bacterium]|nr:hypothetical protein [Bacteriovoracaceae bacterium]